MTVKEALKLAEPYKYAPVVAEVWEYSDKYEISYANEKGEVPDISALYVDKETGEVGAFFPPDYDLKYLKSGKRVPPSKWS